MSVRTLATDVSFLLCCSATMCSCDVLFLLGFGLDLSLFFLWPAFRATFESNAVQDNSINVVSSVSHIIQKSLIYHFFPLKGNCPLVAEQLGRALPDGGQELEGV